MVTASELKATKRRHRAIPGTLRSKSSPAPAKAGACGDRLNLQNRNPKAVEIAQKQLAQLCHATGILQTAERRDAAAQPAVVMKVAVKNDPERARSTKSRATSQGRDQCAGFPGAARNSASRRLHRPCPGRKWPEMAALAFFAPTSSWLRPRLMPSMPQC